MSQFVTVGEIVDRIQYRGNLAGYDRRHPEATLKELWNISFQEYRELVSLHGDGTFLVRSDTAALPTTAAVSGEAYAEVDWPVAAVAIYGVRVQIGSGARWYPLKELPFAAIHDYQEQFPGYGRDGHPVGYIPRSRPAGSGSSEVAGKLMIVPVPTSGNYAVWYLDAWVPLTDDADKVFGHAEALEWSIWSTVIKARAKDGKRDQTFTTAVEERRKVEERILARASRNTEDAPVEPRNGRHDGYEPYTYWDD